MWFVSSILAAGNFQTTLFSNQMCHACFVQIWGVGDPYFMSTHLGLGSPSGGGGCVACAVVLVLCGAVALLVRRHHVLLERLHPRQSARTLEKLIKQHHIWHNSKSCKNITCLRHKFDISKW